MLMDNAYTHMYDTSTTTLFAKRVVSCMEEAMTIRAAENSNAHAMSNVSCDH